MGDPEPLGGRIFRDRTPDQPVSHLRIYNSLFQFLKIKPSFQITLLRITFCFISISTKQYSNYHQRIYV